MLVWAFAAFFFDIAGLYLSKKKEVGALKMCLKA